MNSTAFGKREIRYELIRSSRSKTLSIAVNQEKVTVKAPVTTELENILIS
ncbi:hypothetical protein [Aneurinibacillus migulanus]|nr:hypothetical protein [Aneurinibacillus migulanus]